MNQPSKADIDAILWERFPNLPLIQAAASVEAFQGRMGQAKPVASPSTPSALQMQAEVDAYRAHLEALPAQEVAALAVQSRERAAARVAAELAKKEAARFYNRPEAKADFEFWCKAEYWTPDEAAALLLGRDPRVVKPESLAAELSKPKGMLSLAKPPAPTQFHRQYEGLRALLGRASGLEGSALTPRAAMDWAARTKAIDVPPALIETLQVDCAPAVASTNVAMPSSRGTPTQWPPERKEALREHRRLHGTKAAAAAFGITATRVRQLLPQSKDEPSKAGPFDGLMHKVR